MFTKSILFFLCVISTSAYSQFHELGLFLGGSNYIGDIGTDRYIDPNSPALGLVYKWNVTDRYSLRGGFTFTKLTETEYNNIQKYLEVGIPFYKELGEPVSYQKKVELQFDDLPIPVIGYVDMEYSDCIRDIKTTAKRPSALLPPVQRQIAIYATALEKDRAYADYLYITKTKSEVISFEVDDISMRLNEVYRVASAMMNLLQDNDIYSLCDIVYPDLSNWMWSDSDKQVAKELWRIE